MAVCPDFIHVVLVCVAHTRYTVRRNYSRTPIISAHQSNSGSQVFPAKGPVQPPKPSTDNMEPPPPPLQPLPSPGSSTIGEFVALCACGGTPSLQQPIGQGPAASTGVRHKALSNPQPAFQPPKVLTRVEGIQVGRIASQHPFARRRALACVSDYCTVADTWFSVPSLGSKGPIVWPERLI